MVIDIREVQTYYEDKFINQQAAVENAAMQLDYDDRLTFLTNYSAQTGQQIHNAWVRLGNHLVTKYNDGYIKDSSNRIRSKGYSDEWLKKVVELEGERFFVGE